MKPTNELVTSGPGLGELPDFWDLVVFRRAPIPRKAIENFFEVEPNVGPGLPNFFLKRGRRFKIFLHFIYIHSFLHNARHERGSVEKKRANSFVMSLKKALTGIPPS